LKTEAGQNAVKVIGKSPTACCDAEIADFIALVLGGGEVRADGLEERVRSAEWLVFLREGTCLVGVAGLKCPAPAYRRKIEALSGIPLAQESFPFELGWIYILPSARRRGLSLPLCRRAIEAARASGIFATSRTGNHAMHKTLEKLGFLVAGSEYPSANGNDRLKVFLRRPTTGQHAPA